MKVNIYKKSTQKKIGFLEIEDKKQVINFLRDGNGKEYFYILEGETTPIRV